MRLLIDIIDWDYPSTRAPWTPHVMDLRDSNAIYSLVLAYGNGVILEVRAEGDCEEAVAVLRGLACGTGASKPVELSPEEKESLWLWQEGDICLRQPGENGGYTFIHPVPQPDKFPPLPPPPPPPDAPAA
jgi:hypothetical protein